MKAKINKITVDIVQDDILTLQVDCIVTVTDPNLHVDPALLAVAGETVTEQTRLIGWSNVGTSVITGAGDMLTVKKIIHTVGPRLGEDQARGKLARATWQCLELADANDVSSIALPPISTGTLGYPMEASAKIMIEQIIDFTFEKLKSLRRITICVDDTQNARDIFDAEFRRQLDELKNAGEGQVRA